MICPNCTNETLINVIINGTLMTKCVNCGVYHEKKDEKNKSIRFGSVGLVSTWKDKDYGTGLK
jgi:uncharacterized Zn finger protein